jgi:hypothetical protein
MGGQFHQITSKLKKLLYDSGSAPLLVPISWLQVGKIHFQRQNDNVQDKNLLKTTNCQ